MPDPPEPLDYRPHDAKPNQPKWVPQRVGNPRHFTKVAYGRMGIAMLILAAAWKLFLVLFNP